jgi:peptidase E
MLILTSDFPSTASEAVLAWLRQLERPPVVAWIPPLSALGQARFPAAQAAFRSLGIDTIEFCDIDEAPDEQQLSRLERYDAVYLTGGDPLLFQRQLQRRGVADRLRSYLDSGRTIIAASGGAMQFGRNVSLYRLMHTPLETVLAERKEYEGLGLADCELLPHLNRLEASFVSQVQRYSEQIEGEIVALDDGAAAVYGGGGLRRYLGRVVTFRNGHQEAVDVA